MWICGQDIPTETQYLIVETTVGSHFGEDNEVDDVCHQSALHTIFLPILEVFFRAVIQGNLNTELETVLKSGDAAAAKEFEGSHLKFMAARLAFLMLSPMPSRGWRRIYRNLLTVKERR